jgi:hypothetical protein
MLVKSVEQQLGAKITALLVKPSAEISNSHSLTHRITEGAVIGQAVPVEVVEPKELDEDRPHVNLVSGDTETDCDRKKMLLDQLQDELCDMPETQKDELITLLGRYDHVFMEGERGETTMHINTGEAIPKKQHVRRVPFAVRQEISRQLGWMQDQGVIQPSSSPWASPIILVRKKDGICASPQQCHET